MPEEVTPSASVEGSTEPATTAAIPTDFREYVKWRTTGEPAPEEKTEETPAATETSATPPGGVPQQAKTEPDSEPEVNQESEEAEPGDEESGEKEDRGKRPSSLERKLARVIHEREDYKRELEEIKRRLDEREKPPPPKEKAAAAEGEPQLEQFETLQDYQRALAKHFFDQARQEEAKARVVAQVQEAWDGKEKAARKAHTDYDDVIDSFKVPEGPGVMAARHAMLEDPHGAEILYYLGKRQKEVARIASLDPINAVREIGRLSAMFDASSVPETAKRITSAPKPPPPVGRPAKTSSDSLDDPEVVSDYSRWEKLRLAQLRRK